MSLSLPLSAGTAVAPQLTYHAHVMPFGARLIGDGRCRFRLWAPAQRRVQLCIDAQPPRPMRRLAEGWFTLDAEAAAGSRYHFLLDDGLAVPDPAARAQAGVDVHGPSRVVDPQAYAWRDGHWRGRPWRETVIYELHVGACGGFDGVRRLLPRLAALGVTAVQLMPIADFPGARNWGYDGVLPYAPAAAYGSPEALKALVDRAHELRLMVFLDVVCNHFGPDGCYLHRYAPDFFRDDVHTPWGAAIDFRCAQVRDFFTHNLLYWLREYRFDGLRFDAVHAMTDHGWLAEVAARLRQACAGRQLHLMVEDERLDGGLLHRGFDAQWRDDIHHPLHVMLSGERHGYYRHAAEAPAQRLVEALRAGFAGPGQAPLPPTAGIAFLQNHDQIGNRPGGERLSCLAAPAALQAATALLLLAPTVPLLFMGEEWASRQPFLFFTDHPPPLAEAVREGRRAETRRLGAHPALAARLPDPNAVTSFLRSLPRFADALSAEGAGWQARVAALLRLRRAQLVPRLEGSRLIDAEVLAPRALRARWRLGDGACLDIACNLGETALALAPGAGRLLHDSRPGAAAQWLPGPGCRVWLQGP